METTAQMTIINIDNETTYFPYRPKKNKIDWKNPFGPTLCSIGIILANICLVILSYGTFTDGLPHINKYEYNLAAAHMFAQQLREMFALFWFLLKIFRRTLNQLAHSLHHNTCLCWLTFGLIIFTIGKIGHFHNNL